MKKRILLICIVVLSGLSMVSAQNSKEDKKVKEQQEAALVKAQLDSKAYKIDVDRAFPSRGRSISLNSSYSLEIKNDSVFSWLPFYGRAYSIPYGGGDGLTFKAPLSEYKISYNKKGKARIEATARTSEDLYQYTIDVYSNGSSNISVTMQNREPISFSGTLNVKEEK